MRAWLSRLADLVMRRQRDERLSEEMQSHLDMLADEHVANGLSAADAQFAARKSFGGVDQVKMRYREQRGLPIVDALMQDVKFAFRVLARDRGFALTAILVLGVGLGVNNMFFTLVYAHKFRGVDINDVERVMHISTFDDRGTNRLMSLPEFHDLQAATSFTGLAAYVNGLATVGDEGRAPDRFNGAYVTANAFPLLGLSPSLGRLPFPDDDRPGGERIVLLGSDAWRLRYNSDPQILGRSVLVNGSPATVVGIIPERSGFPSAANIWLPLGQYPDLKPDRSARSLNVVGRVRDGVSIDAARSEVETIFGGFEATHPDTNRNVRARVVPLNERLLGTLDGWMQFILAGIIVILVACANAANLMMARALHRAPEIAIRTSLGASRGRIVGQLLIEALVIAGAAAVVGGAISIAGVRAVALGIPEGTLPYWADYTMDRAVFGGLVGLSLATIVVFGLIPAIQASRTDVNRTLKDGGRANTGAGMGVLTGAFLSVELALAMILGAQVAVASYLGNRPMPTDANINTTEIVTAAVTLPAASYPTPQQRMDFFSRLEERLKARAEVVSVSRASLLPGEGASPRLLQIRGQEVSQGEPRATVLTIDISPRYFETLALGVLKGRDFTVLDGGPDTTVAIVNDRFAQVFLEGRDAIGAQLAVTPANAPADTEPRWATVDWRSANRAPGLFRPWPRGTGGLHPDCGRRAGNISVAGSASGGPGARRQRAPRRSTGDRSQHRPVRHAHVAARREGGTVEPPHVGGTGRHGDMDERAVGGDRTLRRDRAACDAQDAGDRPAHGPGCTIGADRQNGPRRTTWATASRTLARHGGRDGMGRCVYFRHRRRLRQRAADSAEDCRLHRRPGHPVLFHSVATCDADEPGRGTPARVTSEPGPVT